MADGLTLDLFAPEGEGGPGSLAIDAEITALVATVLHQAEEHGAPRETIAARMSYWAGERVSVNCLNDWAAPSHPHHRISLARAAAFDAAVDGNPLLGLLAAKRGLRLVSTAEAALIELGRIHQQERDLAARRRALEVLLRGKS